jgi:hypothetical protein
MVTILDLTYLVSGTFLGSAGSACSETVMPSLHDVSHDNRKLVVVSAVTITSRYYARTASKPHPQILHPHDMLTADISHHTVGLDWMD